MAGGNKVSRKQNLLAYFFSHTIELNRMKFDMAMKQFKLNFLRLLRVRLIGSRE